MADNDFLPFATGGDANVLSQADYAALAALPTGFQSGKAASDAFNKVWRQATFVAAALAQLIPDLLGVNATDDGDFASFLANLKLALQSNNGAAQTLIDVGPDVLTAAARDVFVNRTIAAPNTVKLPVAPSANQEVTIYDDKGDAEANNITIDGNGNTINGAALAVINQNYQVRCLRWNAAGTEWRIKT